MCAALSGPLIGRSAERAVSGQFSRSRLWAPPTHGRIYAVNWLAYGAAAMALASLMQSPQAAAEPATVGTAVNVVINASFEKTSDADQCVGVGALAAVRRGASVVLLEGSVSPDAPKVAVGQFFRSRLSDGACQVLYITSAPVMPAFSVQFVGPEGEPSSVFGPNRSEPVTDQPGIQQVVHVDLAFAPQP
jgi:hypothetical protein